MIALQRRLYVFRMGGVNLVIRLRDEDRVREWRGVLMATDHDLAYKMLERLQTENPFLIELYELGTITTVEDEFDAILNDTTQGENCIFTATSLDPDHPGTLFDALTLERTDFMDDPEEGGDA